MEKNKETGFVVLLVGQ